MSTVNAGDVRHIGDGVYIHRKPGGDFAIAVNDHRNEVVYLEAPVAAALVKFIGGPAPAPTPAPAPAPSSMPLGDSRPDACVRGEAVWNYYKANGRAGRGPLFRQISGMISDLLVFGASEANVATEKANDAGEEFDDLLIFVMDDVVELAADDASHLMEQD